MLAYRLYISGCWIVALRHNTQLVINIWSNKLIYYHFILKGEGTIFTLCNVNVVRPTKYIYHINSLIIFTLCIMKKTTIVNVVMPLIVTLIYLSFSVFVLRRTFTMTMLWSLMDRFKVNLWRLLFHNECNIKLIAWNLYI